MVLEGAGETDPLSIKDYESLGGFAALRAAFALEPQAIIREITGAKLLGRGGAAYPAGKKWEQLLNIEGSPKYIVCNADEGEPGTFKDRRIMEAVPLRLLEGMIIAGLTFNSPRGFIYVRGEYRRLQRRLAEAIQILRDAGYLGERILGSPFSFEITTISGAGAYVCGENSALLNSAEGLAGRPRIKPPHLAEVGLFLKPTLVNNVESFANIPLVLTMGGEKFLQAGHPQSGGSKLVCLSGHVRAPGVYEVPLGGATLRDIIFSPQLGDGIRDGRELGFFHLGGQSGPLGGPADLDVPYAYYPLRERGLAVGSGAVVALDASVSPVEYLQKVAEFFSRESCGKCVPCREGNKILAKYLQKLQIPGAWTPEDERRLSDLMVAMRRASFCGLGQSATTALASAQKLFPGRFAGASAPAASEA
jgi:NADH-quinone oxidoreductase subunit F